MTDPNATAQDPQNAVLARIVAAHRREAVAARDRTAVLSAAWTRALRHAGQPFEGLDLTPGEVTVSEFASLAAVLAALPEYGLVAALEDRDGRRGLIALSNGLVDALVEVLTTGRVEPRGHAPRTVTRIDEALSRDFIDFCLAALSKETEPIEDRDWPRRMTYGSHIADRRQLTLLMPEVSYHVLSANVALGGGGDREGQGVIILPSDPSLVEGQPTPPEGRAPGAPPEDWRAVIASLLADAEIPLQAVLLRTRRSLRDVERLEDGALIDFSHDDLVSVDLQTAGGSHVLTGRLGQIGGMRALRVTQTGVLPAAGDTAGNAGVGDGLGAFQTAEAAATPNAIGTEGPSSPSMPGGQGTAPVPEQKPMSGLEADSADMEPGPMPMGLPIDMAGGPAHLPDLPEIDPPPMPGKGATDPSSTGGLPTLSDDAAVLAPSAMPMAAQLDDAEAQGTGPLLDPLGFEPQTAPIDLDDLPQ